ncbi:DoxX family membrane protein [Flavobacterium arcticum]|uniref:DoxX family membrane protein n=1 Tax=Flavobacterium arcticum TaxID=1784713 RepID=A0A345HD70_9FLAO|nr:TQO small subunit DoxD [Flavobacterium arcticum]AXG74530.1 DoxX family membrane protein [Flavobacterium arcticum]KAF2512349.1 DoxX family membrane protein [Flavobacterium arcticum]
MQNIHTENQHYKMAGTITLALRLVIGWTYFSAFWRRLILENKLDPDTAGYIGQKFNHFLPNALGIKPIIEHLVLNPDKLWIAMVVFTIIEAIVGLFIMFGLFTRLMSIGVIALAMGILLGSGWIGTTCLDEWQIGVLGIAGGFILFLSGSSYFSMDNFLLNKEYRFTNNKWFRWLGSGNLSLKSNSFKTISLIGALLILSLTLFTNQYFHGGLWGKLHNKSAKPVIELSDAVIDNNTLSFNVYRTEGVDVYGSFLIAIALEDAEGNIVLKMEADELANLSPNVIKNIYVAKVKPGKHSLIIPLGAKANINLKHEKLIHLKSSVYILKLTDVSGIVWRDKVQVK